MEDTDLRGLIELCTLKGVTIATAESCTGGYLSSRITDVPGSSRCFLGGVVAYRNDVKVRLLGVKEGTLDSHGAVSREVAIEMAEGCMRNMGSDLAVSLSGIAGPSGSTSNKPVGRLFIAISTKGKETLCEGFSLGDMGRSRFKVEAAKRALGLLMGRVRSLEKDL